MKKHITFALLFAAALTAQAQQGGISGEMLNQIKQSYKATPADKAIRNALGGTSINTLALNQENRADFDTEFSHKVLSKGITDQQSSGRCWLFTGLNVLRSQMIAKYGLDEMEFSQNYCFFYDQLEKANLFLQGIIDTSGKPMDDKMVEWLFKHPLSDGGQFTGVSDIIEKYGLVPKSAMVETFSSENTGKMSSLIGLKLKEFGLQLREAAATGAKPAELEKKKTKCSSDNRGGSWPYVIYIFFHLHDDAYGDAKNQTEGADGAGNGCERFEPVWIYFVPPGSGRRGSA